MVTMAYDTRMGVYGKVVEHGKEIIGIKTDTGVVYAKRDKCEVKEVVTTKEEWNKQHHKELVIRERDRKHAVLVSKWRSITKGGV